ncbi:MAG: biopolymer transporter ExbD [Phycisphaerales bacterium]|nr:biopolymer transporter ExbD [Phycisphaerales bacterium]
MPEVEMTPMIDIVFLLIIFFMVAAQFAQQARLDLDLPRERGEQMESKEESGLVINIGRDGSIVLETDQPAVTLDVLEQRIAQAVASGQPDWQGLMIRADRNADASTLNEVIELLHDQGLSATRIATEVPR